MAPSLKIANLKTGKRSLYQPPLKVSSGEIVTTCKGFKNLR